jgi:hypothetical protein
MRGKVVVGVSGARVGGDAGDLSLPIVVVVGQNGSSRARVKERFGRNRSVASSGSLVMSKRQV